MRHWDVTLDDGEDWGKRQSPTGMSMQFIYLLWKHARYLRTGCKLTSSRNFGYWTAKPHILKRLSYKMK